MSRRAPTSPAATLALVAALGGCAGAPTCGTSVGGATLRWSEINPDPARSVVVLPVLNQAPASIDASERTALLRFDATALGDGPSVDRAALVLVPSPGAVRDRCVLLRVRAVDEPWSPAAVARGDLPALDDGGAAEVTLPAQRVPVRVDVTALVRSLGPEGLAGRGIALTATRGGAAFRGSGTLAPEERPRLEVLLR